MKMRALALLLVFEAVTSLNGLPFFQVWNNETTNGTAPALTGFKTPVSVRANLIGIPSLDAHDESGVITALEQLKSYVYDALISSILGDSKPKSELFQMLAVGTQGKQHLYGISFDVSIGDPEQIQTLLLSFMTSNFWVVGKQYYLSRLMKNRFDESVSTTLSETNEEFKFDGREYNAAGHYVIDNVQFGELSAAKQRFGVAKSVPFYFPLYGINGVFGLAAAVDGSEESALANFLDEAVDPVLSIYHNPLASVWSNSPENVVVTFGGSDEKYCQNNWVDVKATNYAVWMVDVYGLSIDKNPRRNVNAEKGIIVSTFPVTLVPRRTIIHLANILNGTEIKKKSGIYRLPCDNLPTLYFNIGPHRIPMEPQNYIVKMCGSCYMRIFETNEKFRNAGVDFVFAEPLLRSNCIRFDPIEKQVSFATPIPTAQSEGSE